MFRHKNIFFSYQVHPEEELTEEVIAKNKLIFMHDYAAPPKVFEKTDKEKFCPLNGAVSIVNKCYECRQCFDGSFISSG
ncbi:hypothetical protein N9V16_04615 [SAR116 cluster bacterium]|nr:hypothetical protein [SAR116 cluster bacterium]